jgi:hypothetical protein
MPMTPTKNLGLQPLLAKRACRIVIAVEGIREEREPSEAANKFT